MRAEGERKRLLHTGSTWSHCGLLLLIPGEEQEAAGWERELKAEPLVMFPCSRLH